MRIASFDIFDTSLIRKTGSPESVFRIVSQRAFHDVDLQRAFFLWRRSSEQKLRENNGQKEVSLYDIYQTLDEQSFCTHLSREEILGLEKQVESELLVANPSIKSLVQKKRKEGYCILFVSDMYLDSTFLRDVLLREGLAYEDDGIFVSCEHNASKSNRRLYQLIKNQLKPKHWEHYGDDWVADVKNARRNGIHAYHVTTSYSEIESETRKSSVFFDGLFSLSDLTGISRYVRVACENTPSAALASDLVIPIYLPYCVHCLELAQKRNIKRLYFLSRDSYVLMKTAQVFQPEYPDIDIRYLFVSKKALLLPFLGLEFGKNAYLSLQNQAKRTIVGECVDSLLAALGVTREELSKYQIDIPFDTIATHEQEDYFLSILFEGHYAQILKDNAETSLRLLKRYLVQEGFADGESSALIDLGWYGVPRMVITRILDSIGKSSGVEFFYLSCNSEALPPGNGRYHVFIPGEMEAKYLVGLFESYFSICPYPTTIGYGEENGRIVPRFPDNSGIKVDDNLLIINLKALSLAAEVLCMLPGRDNTVLFTWAVLTIRLIREGNVHIDWSPLSVRKWDGIPIVKRLSIIEWMLIVFVERQVTVLDRASLQFTMRGNRHRKAIQLQKRFSPIHYYFYKLACQIRNKLF